MKTHSFDHRSLGYDSKWAVIMINPHAMHEKMQNTLWGDQVHDFTVINLPCMHKTMQNFMVRPCVLSHLLSDYASRNPLDMMVTCDIDKTNTIQ
jgi:hypothetical protein